MLIENSELRIQNPEFPFPSPQPPDPISFHPSFGEAHEPSSLILHPSRISIRHLLIGSPDIVNRTVHQLHNLRYAEAGLWSPAIALSSEQLILALNPGEVMRVLVRYEGGRS